MNKKYEITMTQEPLRAGICYYLMTNTVSAKSPRDALSKLVKDDLSIAPLRNDQKLILTIKQC